MVFQSAGGIGAIKRGERVNRAVPALAYSGLEGTNVVITGAGRGLGAALSIACAAAGATVVLCGRNENALEEVARRIVICGGPKPLRIPLDLASNASIRAATERIANELSVVDILINNAAMWLEERELPFTDGEITATVNTAAAGTLLLIQELRPLLLKSTRPDIVTIGSVSGLPNAETHGVSLPFYVAKHAQAALADGLRQQCIGTPMRSICVHPPWLEDIQPDDPEWEVALERPKGAMATNRDAVEAVLFAVTRPRNVTIATMVIDSDRRGISAASHH